MTQIGIGSAARRIPLDTVRDPGPLKCQRNQRQVAGALRRAAHFDHVGCATLRAVGFAGSSTAEQQCHADTRVSSATNDDQRSYG